MTQTHNTKYVRAALAGNPNVGKSSLFNRLTGLDQHTGNWTGKTVATAIGCCERQKLTLVDLPGTYSLRARSAEEEVARDYIKSGEADVIIAVCDACNLERGLSLVLQILELTTRVVVCVNLIDEAKARGITIDLEALQETLGVPVVAVSARKSIGLDKMCRSAREVALGTPKTSNAMSYPPEFESDLSRLSKAGFLRGDVVNAVLGEVPESYAAMLISRPIITAEAIANDVVMGDVGYSRQDRKIDRIITHRFWSIPIMLVFLCVILWLTIVGSNYPSELLSSLFAVIETKLYELCRGLPPIIRDPLIDGVVHTLFSVVAVMLPPMTIFFPLFTIAEDFGLLGRIAFNLDGAFKKSGACGKQALTMCMSLGCTAAGAVGCRIIDSPRERKLAIISASFMPCNGKFPILIAISVILAGSTWSAFVLTLLIMCAILVTLAVSKILTKTVLRGEASSFALELPSYRRVPIGRVIVHSLVNRTLYLLTRAVIAAAPAGLIIWLLTNVHYQGASLLAHAANFLDPIGLLLGLDGVILCAFVLAFPANELVLPLIMSGYASLGLTPQWSTLTCINLLILTLFHFPCATTVLTIKKESDTKTTLLSIFVPTVVGITLCAFMQIITQLLKLLTYL